MTNDFLNTLQSFLDEEGATYRIVQGVLHVDAEQGLRVEPVSSEPLAGALVSVPLEVFVRGSLTVPVFLLPSFAAMAPIFLYEDRWWNNPGYWKERLRVRLGKAERIFARNCRIVEPDPASLKMFLAQCHTYGFTKAKHRYALQDRDGRVVAVATFSAPRPMQRGVELVESWEWVRYASLPSLVVVGGMSRLLSAFVRDVHPQEVMTYADREWSVGNAYRDLGFEAVDRRAPVEFWVDPADWSRHSVAKINNDRTYRGTVVDYAKGFVIRNLGSEKFLKRYW